jgi:hypothetical protein
MEGTMPQMSIKGLAKYIVASPAQQRKVIRDYKYPQAEGLAQANYYRDAKECIREYHRGTRARTWLEGRSEALYGLAAAETGSRRTKIQNNARAIRDYAINFHDRIYQVQPQQRFRYLHGGMIITLSPDLCVTDRNRTRYVFFNFARVEADPSLQRIMVQCLYDAIRSEGIVLGGRDVQVQDVPRGATIFGARLSSRTRNEIEAACETINTLWPSIAP